jgi:hypothetical protein
VLWAAHYALDEVLAHGELPMSIEECRSVTIGSCRSTRALKE